MCLFIWVHPIHVDMHSVRLCSPGPLGKVWMINLTESYCCAGVLGSTMSPVFATYPVGWTSQNLEVVESAQYTVCLYSTCVWIYGRTCIYCLRCGAYQYICTYICISLYVHLTLTVHTVHTVHTYIRRYLHIVLVSEASFLHPFPSGSSLE